jgi:probable rRNA maturation factor
MFQTKQKKSNLTKTSPSRRTRQTTTKHNKTTSTRQLKTKPSYDNQVLINGVVHCNKTPQTLVLKTKTNPILSSSPPPHSLPTSLSTTLHTAPLTASIRNFAFKPQAGRKLSQAELIIQQHKEKQQAVELEKIRAAQAAKANPPPPKEKKQKKIDNDNDNISYEKPMQQPSREFLRDQKPGKFHKLPPGMTIEDLNKMPPEVIAKTLNIDMSMIDSLNDDREDEFGVQFSEDSTADATPPLPFRPDPGEEGVNYTAARIQGRHTVNMMPSVPPRPASHKGRVTIIRKLPPQFEEVHRSLRKVTHALMKAQRLSHFDLAVTLVAAQGMQFINRQHRFVDSPTDVLAFTMEEPYCEGIPVELGNIADLGEIIISVPYVYAQAAIRHEMLRSLGYDLSDSRRPLDDFEKVKKLFANIGHIKIDENSGELIIDSLIDQQNANVNADGDIYDLEQLDQNGNSIKNQNKSKYGQQALTLAGSLPSVTLTSTQLDSLPPFDKDFITSQVRDTMHPAQKEVHDMVAMNRKMQSAHKLLESFEGDDLVIDNKTGGKKSTQNDAEILKQLSMDSHLQVRKDPTSNTALETTKRPKWTLSQGFPPRDYFKYITESMVIDEMNIVLIHGFLHLCGYDHDTNDKRERMQEETDRVVGILLKEGAISQRCADLSTLYVLDEAPEYIDEASEDELLPAGLFMDQDAKPMTDEQIEQKLNSYNFDKKVGTKNAQSSNKSHKTKNTGAFSSQVTSNYDPSNPISSRSSQPSSRIDDINKKNSNFNTATTFAQNDSNRNNIDQNIKNGPTNSSQTIDLGQDGPEILDHGPAKNVKIAEHDQIHDTFTAPHSLNRPSQGSGHAGKNFDMFKQKKPTKM